MSKHSRSTKIGLQNRDADMGGGRDIGAAVRPFPHMHCPIPSYYSFYVVYKCNLSAKLGQRERWWALGRGPERGPERGRGGPDGNEDELNCCRPDCGDLSIACGRYSGAVFA